MDRIYRESGWSLLSEIIFFGHTSNLENFNSMLLKYAPKRIAFAQVHFTITQTVHALPYNIKW